MSIEDLGLLLENIEEYVTEQKKIVTYKWLSRTFSLNVNRSKQLLATFHKKHKALNHKSIQGVYFVSGMRRNSAGLLTHQVCLVGEELLEATKAQLEPVTSVHLYSVQKGKPKDTAPIYNVDLEQTRKQVYSTADYSMIKCEDAKISQIVNNRPVTPPALKNKVKVLAPGVSETNSTAAVKVEPKKPSAAVGKKQGTLGTVTTKTTKTYARSETKKTTTNKNSLNNFFGKGKSEAPKPADGAKKSPAKSKKAEPPKPAAKTEKPSPTKPTKTEKIPSAKTEKVAPAKKTPPAKRDAPKKERKSPASSPQSKACRREPLSVDDELLEREEAKEVKKGGSKRKRVLQFSSDEEMDEGICLDQDKGGKAAPNKKARPTTSPTTTTTSPTPKSDNGGGGGRKRVRKLVSQTTVNADGFMETEKVWQTVSCSEDEDEEVEVTKETKAPTAAAATEVRSTRSTNKQSNLMGFFKKS